MKNKNLSTKNEFELNVSENYEDFDDKTNNKNNIMKNEIIQNNQKICINKINEDKMVDENKIIESVNSSDAKLKKTLQEFVYHLYFAEDNQKNTIISYLYDIKLSMDFFVQYKNEDFNFDSIKKLSKLDFRSLYSHRKNKNVSAISHKRLISAWRKFYSFLGYESVFANLHIKSAKLFPKPIKKEIIEDLLKVNGNWISYRNRALWGLLYGSGVRISEALNLNISDWNSESLEILGKGKVIRKVPVLNLINTWMMEYLDQYPIAKLAESPLFIGKKLKRLNSQTCAHILRKWRIKNNLDQKITPHSLRHSFASHVLRNKCSLKILQEVLGHKNLDTTSIYAHVDDEQLEESFMKFMN